MTRFVFKLAAPAARLGPWVHKTRTRTFKVGRVALPNAVHQQEGTLLANFRALFSAF